MSLIRLFHQRFYLPTRNKRKTLQSALQFGGKHISQ